MESDEGPVTRKLDSFRDGGKTRSIPSSLVDLGEEASDDQILAEVRQRLFAEGRLISRIGRFQVLEEIGSGGMGTVYAAYDEQLDRKVAVKVLREESNDGESRQRFVREAQAMALVSHPNVVTVHEAGETDGEAFLAMEFIRGQTLGAWCGTAPPWTEVLEAYVQAGRGLAAAHAAGLVHRDLKPHNIMRGDDGRVKVLDFGLARVVDQSDDPTIEPLGSSSSMLASSFTRTGTVMGTPGYMAPEQLRGDGSDARSDQFSFCVALFEALYGERPFEGSTLQELAESIERSVVRSAPRGTDVPVGVHKVLLRGLASDPELRWPSIEALLEPLSARIAPPSRRWVAPTVFGGVLALGLVVGIGQYAAESQRCTGAASHLTGIWDEERRQEVREALLGTRVAYAADTWSRVERRLDEYREAWTEAHTEACEATSVRREQSEAEMSLRMGCLRGRRQHLRGVVDELSRADDGVVERAVQAVNGLPRISRCAEVEALAAEVPPPDDPEVAAQVLVLEERLAAIEAKRQAARYQEGLELIELAVVEVEALEHPPLMVRAWLIQAGLLSEQGRFDEGVEILRRAYELALVEGLLPQASRAASEIVCKLGINLVQLDDALEWAVHAEPMSRGAQSKEVRLRFLKCSAGMSFSGGEYDEARVSIHRALDLLDTMPEAPPMFRASFLANLCGIDRTEGRYVEARASGQRALEISEAVLGPRHPMVAHMIENLGIVAFSEGKLDEAHDLMTRTLAIREEALGPDHLQVAESLAILGAVAGQRRETQAAREIYERALAIRRARLGPQHPLNASLLENLANVDLLEDRFDSARERYEDALAIKEAALGPDHPEVGELLHDLGNFERMLGRLDEALEFHMRALAVQEAALGPKHPVVGETLSGLCLVARQQGKLEEAHNFCARAVAAWESAGVPQVESAIRTSIDHGEILLELGRAGEAVTVLDGALALCSDCDEPTTRAARIRYALARALWEAPSGEGRDRGRALVLAEYVRRLVEDDADLRTEKLVGLEDWLAERSGDP